jgi:hypothetical protein
VSDSRIIIIGLLTISVVLLFKPMPDAASAKDILLFVLGALAGYMRREPQYQQLPPPPAADIDKTQELKGGV